MNVTSGGAYIPQPFAPVYSACKAALHSYTVTLRHSLRDTLIRVVELIPPAVATGLAGPGNNHGAPVDDFCDTVFPQLFHRDLVEVGYGITASNQFEAAKKPYRDMFASFSNRFPTAAYASR
ncbi:MULTISPECIES: SDR family NAD(P)-dependent oxidoreductase [Asaia]|uniref:SDR family NAD(P)-dependent oxidoreductase n=1 Tax=Asaia TaxID=91914 RepID=UPI002FC2AEBF